MTSTWQQQVGLAGLLVSLLACAGTPVTEPPSVAPPDLMNVDTVETLPAFQGANDEAARPIGLAGRRGAVPANALVWTINLDGDVPAVLLRADADGSFTIPIAARADDELRMHVLVDGVPSPALNMTVTEGLALQSPTHGECVRATPTMIDFGTVEANMPESLDLLIENTCSESLEFSAALHASAVDFGLDGQSSGAIEPGESSTVTLVFEATAGTSLRSSVLLIDLSMPAGDDRLAVTLWGRVR